MFAVEDNSTVLGETIYSSTLSENGDKNETVFGQSINTSQYTSKYIESTDSIEENASILMGNSTIDLSCSEDFFGRRTEKTIALENDENINESYKTEITYNDTATTVSNQVGCYK